METMNATLDEPKYRELLLQAVPVVIHAEEEYQRLLHAAGQLMETPDDQITEEQGRLLEMLAMLLEEYEDRAHALPGTELPETEPHKMLNHLLQERGLRPIDLTDILPKSRVSEILSGKRSISKSQAKQLAQRFRVPVSLFI
jgi:HTH-type transcriptional regulator/antitoxin HigA